MGKSKRLKAERRRLREGEAQWLSGLSPPEQQIAAVATATHREVVEDRGLVGGCYLLAFFLTEYLKRERGIPVTPIVGWINDGETPLMSSHAWIEYAGRKTDISLTRTEHPAYQPSGPLLVLDRVVKPGQVTYTYHHERPVTAIAALRDLDEKLVAQAEAQHLEMSARARNEELIKTYIENAPAGRNYAAMKQLIE